MWIKGITRRWLFNVLGIVVLVLVVLIVSLSFAVQNYTYNGILQALNANSRELTNVFIDYKNKIGYKERKRILKILLGAYFTA